MMAGVDGSGQQQNKGRYANGKKKIANNAQQPYAQKNGGIVHHNQMSALSGQDQSSGGAINMISEGALSQLINSHINESDANNKTTQGHSTGNDSFENANLAFWTRKQNEYKANLIQNNSKPNNGGQDMQSVLTNQARIMTHLMSLDECDMSPQEHASTTGAGTANPRSP